MTRVAPAAHLLNGSQGTGMARRQAVQRTSGYYQSTSLRVTSFARLKNRRVTLARAAIRTRIRCRVLNTIALWLLCSHSDDCLLAISTLTNGDFDASWRHLMLNHPPGIIWSSD